MRAATVLLGAVAAAALLGALGWLGSDRLQQSDAFCISCHVTGLDGRPAVMHEALLADFGRSPAPNLAAAHAAEGTPDDPFRCITCHAGTGALGRTRVKWIAFRDMVVWASGRGAEPSHMRVPLGDADCTRCHDLDGDTAWRARGTPIGGLPPFHREAAHLEGDAEVGCSGCHPVHAKPPAAPGAQPAGFLDAHEVRGRCARCHSGWRIRGVRKR